VEDKLLARSAGLAVMKEYGLFLERRLICCSTSKAAVWELLVRLVRELQTSKILPKRLAASPIDFAKAEGVMLSIQCRTHGAPSSLWTEIPGWNAPPKKPRGNSHLCEKVMLTPPAWVRAWISSRASKPPESHPKEEPPKQAAWLSSRARKLLESHANEEPLEQAPAASAVSAAVESACSKTLQRTADAEQMLEEESRQAVAAAPKPEEMERKEQLLRKWLFTARCRLNLTEYTEFRKALGRLHSGRSSCETAELCSLVKLLWGADFPEGPSTHATWILAFAESLPRAMRWVWRKAVHQFAPTPLSFPDSVGDTCEPSADQNPAGQSGSDQQGGPGVDVGLTCAASPQRKEHGWLIERSAAFLNRKRSADADGDGTTPPKRRREML